MSVVNLVTVQNFESKKVEIINSVSKFGVLDRPENWNKYLHIFKFDCESVLDMVVSLLTDEYQRQMDYFSEEFAESFFVGTCM